tara:strand:+ start:2488 stop:3504 length:1017 start_codon:yes stop_codon:yes gene_type:complete
MTINKLKLIEYQNFFELLPDFLFKLPHKIWLIPVYTNIELYVSLHNHLFNNLAHNFENTYDAIEYVTKNMLYMIDSDKNNTKKLSKTFGENANIFNEAYFTFNHITPDIIILETSDNWQNYVKHAIHSLQDYGHFLAIIPSLWLNKNHSMFLFLTQFEIFYLKFINSSKTIIYLQKKPTTEYINIYDLSINKYIRYFIKDNIPLYHQNFIYNLLHHTKKLGYIFIKKVDKSFKFKKNDIKMTINDIPFFIPNINKSDINFFNNYFNSKFVNYILFSFNNNLISGLNSIPNILQYKNEIAEFDNINNFVSKKFNLSIIDIDNISKFPPKNMFNIRIFIV